RAAPAAHERAASDSYACAVLRLEREHVPLVEIGKTALRFKVEPVLRDQGGALAFAAERSIVNGFRVDILQVGSHAVVKTAAQLQLAGFPGGIAVRAEIDVTGLA